MKTIRFTSAITLALMLLVGASALPAGATGPVGTSPNNASYIDNRLHTIDGNGSLWVRFDYSLTDTGDRPVSTITLLNGRQDNLGFDVWTLDELNTYTDSKPIGRGTPYNVDCDTGELSGQGGCQSNDVTWSGAFGESGTYFVRVFNNNASPASAQLSIQGSGVSLGSQPQVAPTANSPTALRPIEVPPANPATAPVLPAQPAVATTIIANLDDPNRAMVIDGNLHTLAAKSAVWYSFDYGISDTGDRPVRAVTLVGGNNSGVRLEVWTPDNLNDWWDKKPIGQGTANNVECNNSDQSGQTQCQSNDLTWGGAFNAGMKIYVRIVNDNDHPTPFQLTLQ